MLKPRLSLCMIVKNEEEFVANCLNSVKDVVDEIIIVDTGSTDRTIEICQTFQAVIKRFEWNGSFADARNYAIRHATGDWILLLDADEELDVNDKSKLREGTHYRDYDVLTIHLINYQGETIDKNNTTDIAHTRLFRNNGMKFENKIHERLDLNNVPKEKIGHLNVKVHHYGYLDAVKESKEKAKRNIEILEHQIEEGENVYLAHYYIALEHYYVKQFQEALIHVNLSILTFLQKRVLPPSMVYKLKYSILIASGNFKEALPGLEKAIMLYPDFVDLKFFKGIVLYHLNDYKAAIQSFEESIKMGEGNLNHLVLKGVGSFRAWYYISLCHKELGEKEKAMKAVMQSILLASEFKEALNTFNEFIKEEGSIIDEYIERHFKEKNVEVLRSIVQQLRE